MERKCVFLAGFKTPCVRVASRARPPLRDASRAVRSEEKEKGDGLNASAWVTLVGCTRLAAPSSPAEDSESTDSQAALPGDVGWGSGM